MKRTIAILLALILLLSLAACGGDSPSEEAETLLSEETELSMDELLAKAQPLSILELNEEIRDNKARALSTYKDGVYTIWGIVSDINTDSVEIKAGYDYKRVRVFLPIEELIEIDTNSVIQVVGTITDIQEETRQLSSYTFDYNIVILENAHFVKDDYEIKNAEISNIVYDRSTYKYQCSVKDENLEYVYFICSYDQISNYQWNNFEKFTVSASGKIVLDKVGNDTCPVMDSSNFVLNEK